MRISTGSLLQFDISFNIPANSTFDKIVVTDPLAPGLTYYPGTTTGAKVYLGTNTAPVAAGVIDLSTTGGATTVSLELGQAIARQTTLTVAKVSIQVKVTDCDALITAIASAKAEIPSRILKNIAKIEAFIGTNVVSKAEAPANLEFEKCMIYGFGSSYSVEKSPGKDVFLIGNFPCIGSLGTDELEYVVTITADSNIDVAGITAANSRVFMGVAQETAVPGFTISVTGQVITIKFKHAQVLKNITVYFILKGVTKTSIANFAENALTSLATCVLNYTPSGGTTSAVCTSPEYTITTNLSAATPVLSVATKTIV